MRFDFYRCERKASLESVPRTAAQINRLRICLAAAALGLCLFASNLSGREGRDAQAENLENEDSSRLAMIVLFRESDFFCPFCLEPLLRFCRMLPFEFAARGTWGLLVPDRRGGESVRSDPAWKLLTRRLRVFRETNRLDFPVLIDREGLFAGSVEEGIRIILLDGEESAPVKLSLPLPLLRIQRLLDRLSRVQMD